MTPRHPREWTRGVRMSSGFYFVFLMKNPLCVAIMVAMQNAASTQQRMFRSGGEVGLLRA